MISYVSWYSYNVCNTYCDIYYSVQYVQFQCYMTNIEHIFENIYYKNAPNLIAKILATNFDFVPDWLEANFWKKNN